MRECCSYARRQFNKKKTRFKQVNFNAETIHRSSWPICDRMEKSNGAHTQTQLATVATVQVAIYIHSYTYLIAPRVSHFSTFIGSVFCLQGSLSFVAHTFTPCSGSYEDNELLIEAPGAKLTVLWNRRSCFICDFANNREDDRKFDSSHSVYSVVFLITDYCFDSLDDDDLCTLVLLRPVLAYHNQQAR